MKLSKRIGVIALTWAVALTGFEAVSLMWGQSGPGFVSEARAVVGRPLTPVSIAGVGRRTVRRCAVGIYHC